MRTGYAAICLVVGITVVPAVAQDSRDLDVRKSARIDVGNEGRAPQRGFGNNSGLSLVEPIGRVWVGAGSVDGEPIHVRRMKEGGGITVVEVSTTPFAPVAGFDVEASRGSMRTSDQPAPW
jgi:hypothetical protein